MQKFIKFKKIINTARFVKIFFLLSKCFSLNNRLMYKSFTFGGVFTNSPQCLHFVAETLISSPQNGQILVSLMPAPFVKFNL